jgi:hypothetical protein
MSTSFWTTGVGIDDAVAMTALPTDSPEQNVRKIYAFVTGLENQSFRAQRVKQESNSLTSCNRTS